MKQSQYTKNTNILNISKLVGLVFIVIMIAITVIGLSDFTDNSQNLSVETIQHTIEKYAIACYATEGSYPPDINYLTEHYGLILDEDIYIYDYEIFGSNVLPSIMVIEKP
jgi:hypothetical protein